MELFNLSTHPVNPVRHALGPILQVEGRQPGDKRWHVAHIPQGAVPVAVHQRQLVGLNSRGGKARSRTRALLLSCMANQPFSSRSSIKTTPLPGSRTSDMVASLAFASLYALAGQPLPEKHGRSMKMQITFDGCSSLRP